MKVVTSHFSSGHQYNSQKSLYILLPPRCITYGLLYASCNIDNLSSESLGSQMRPSKYKTPSLFNPNSASQLDSIICWHCIKNLSCNFLARIWSTQFYFNWSSSIKPPSSHKLSQANIARSLVIARRLRASVTTLALPGWYSIIQS